RQIKKFWPWGIMIQCIVPSKIIPSYSLTCSEKSNISSRFTKNWRASEQKFMVGPIQMQRGMSLLTATGGLTVRTGHPCRPGCPMDLRTKWKKFLSASFTPRDTGAADGQISRQARQV